MDQVTNVARAAHQLGLALAVMHDPLDIARLVTGCIRDLLGTDAVAIFTWDEPTHRLVVQYSTPPAPASVGVRSGYGAVGRAFEQRRSSVLNDRPPPCDAPAWDIALGLHAVAAVPLIVAGAAVGVLSAGRTSNKPFAPPDVDLLAIVGALAVAPTIELERLRGRVRELELRLALLRTRPESGELRMRLETGHAVGRIIDSQGAAMPRLSRRERELLPLLARGYTNREIGSALRLSPGTVRNIVARLLTTLHARDRTHAVVIALAHGLLDAESDARS
jgi:DNA-binding CsgD family transcriptional regulator